MNFLLRKVRLFNKETSVLVLLWFGLAFIAAFVEVLRHTVNDYLIFKGVFWHLWEQTNLYAEYPSEYGDSNHYGPVFALIIAPFALLPTGIGGILWTLANAWILLYAIRKLDVSERNRWIIVAICLVEMMTTAHNLEFNSATAAWLILAFVLVEKKQDFWATFFIALGFMVKLYGIGGLLFFVFSQQKLRFALSFVFWLIVLFCLPMLLSSPRFVVQSYVDWYDSLVVKDAKNANVIVSGGMQDISVMGMIRRIFSVAVENLYVLVPAALMILLPLLRFSQYASKKFRQSFLAIVLISVVIFSTAAESSTYVIAMAGVGIWYVLQPSPKSLAVSIALVFALIITSFSPTDLFPHYINVHYVRAYSLKALPCFVVWLWLITTVGTTDFRNSKMVEA